MSDIATKLLTPISPEQPCGEDIWLAEGRFVLQQPLESAWRNGETVNWDDMRDQSLDLLQRSRDIRAAIVYCLSLLQTEGLDGFADGVKLVRALLENFWGTVYPRPETPEDEILANVLGNLSAALGSDTPYQFVKFLRETPLCRSSAGADYSLADVERAEKSPVEGEEAPATTEQIASAFRATPPETLQKERQLASDIVSDLDGIETFIGEKSNGQASINFEALKVSLNDIIGVYNSYVGGQSDNSASGQKPSSVAAAPGGAVGMPTGGIKSRADADAALAAVSDYFKRYEPSSPVPLLIDRTRRLLKMDFIASMQDMAPEALDKLNMLFGIKGPPPEENPGA